MERNGVDERQAHAERARASAEAGHGPRCAVLFAAVVHYAVILDVPARGNRPPEFHLNAGAYLNVA